MLSKCDWTQVSTGDKDRAQRERERKRERERECEEEDATHLCAYICTQTYVNTLHTHTNNQINICTYI